MTMLLVANDFPPKHGGIQTYLWEIVRRLPSDQVTVLTTAHDGAAEFDRSQPFRVERTRDAVLLPTPALADRINALAAEVHADALVIDPPVPLGLLHDRLDLPYHVVLHGGVVGYARPPGLRHLLATVLRSASGIISAGQFAASEAARAAGTLPPVTLVPPGVDTDRFRPMQQDEKAKARAAFGLPVEGRLVVSLSRLVPRKGMDILIHAAARLALTRPDLTVAIGGDGRDRTRLERLAAKTGAPVRFLGRVEDDALPAAYACADVFAMLCRDRWAGLEQEGFGIVFMESAACGVPQVAGASGGASDAVADGETGLMVHRPRDVAAVATAVARLLDDTDKRQAMGAAGRARAEAEFTYDVLARRFAAALPINSR
jgi:phosphatidylinositol alpha-1,6-mannosyltransferase